MLPAASVQLTVNVNDGPPQDRQVADAPAASRPGDDDEQQGVAVVDGHAVDVGDGLDTGRIGARGEGDEGTDPRRPGDPTQRRRRDRWRVVGVVDEHGRGPGGDGERPCRRVERRTGDDVVGGRSQHRVQGHAGLACPRVDGERDRLVGRVEQHGHAVDGRVEIARRCRARPRVVEGHHDQAGQLVGSGVVEPQPLLHLLGGAEPEQRAVLADLEQLAEVGGGGVDVIRRPAPGARRGAAR